MKISLCTITSAALAATVEAVEYSVSSCADFMAVDDNDLTSLVVTSSPIECDDYLRFVVRNDMTLSATVPEVVLSNVSLKIKDGLEVVIEPDIVFKDVYEVGKLIFQEDAFFVGCSSNVDFGLSEKARGGAISNSAPGVIHFKTGLTMDDNYAGGVFYGQGGAIYNRGDIVVDGDAVFYDNLSSDGGGIYQEKWGSFETNGMANFTDNYVFEYRGGGICNFGGVVSMNAGSVFHNNVASCNSECGSGGAIFNEDGGVVTLAGPTTFTNNSASFGGAIFNQEVSGSNSQENYEIPVITLPDDVVFLDNSALCGVDFYNGNYSTCP